MCKLCGGCRWGGRFLAHAVLLELTHEGGLVGSCLETTVSKLGTCVDKLEVDLLQSDTLGVDQQ